MNMRAIGSFDDWLASPERDALVTDADTFVEKSEVRAAGSDFATWFKFGAKDDSSAPPWKMNYIISSACIRS
jgi:antibiotic biosynthesis monooxygenase (ABM) superfamily enzyme